MKTRIELEAMTVKQLRRYVIDRGLSFPYLGETTKAEIIDKLMQIRAEREDETPAPPQAKPSGLEYHAHASPNPAPAHPLPPPAAPGVHMPHTSGDIEDLFSLYRNIVHDTAMSVDARAGYLTAVVRVDARISRRLDRQPNQTLVALFRERLAAEDSQRGTVHPRAAETFRDAADEMSRAELGGSSDE